MQCGETPTIKDAAEAAGVSRATAYRYFTSQQALLLEASLDAIGTVPDPSLVDEARSSPAWMPLSVPLCAWRTSTNRPAHLSNAFLGAVAAHPPEEQRQLPLAQGPADSLARSGTGAA